MPCTDEDWRQEAIGFYKNCGLPCVAAWNDFHVYFGTDLKNFCSLKKIYSTKNMGLIGYNKRFLAATANVPGSTHDAHLLRYTEVFPRYCRWIRNKTINLRQRSGEIPLVTVGGSVFPRYT